MKKYRQVILAAMLIFVAGMTALIYFASYRSVSPVWNPLRLHGGHGIDHTSEEYCIVFTESGSMLTKTARRVFKGDEVITGDGKHYRVTRTKGDRATAKYLGMDEKFLAWQNYFEHAEIPAQTGKLEIGVYHSHSDESYVPTDGSESEPYKGGIMEVGEAFVEKLKKQGVNVIHDRTPHEPHDANSYMRSRRTAVRLQKKNPVALFDIHRDGVPDADFYKRQVSGEAVTQLRLVVGRQNPNMNANLDFARRLMSYTNKIHPGLIKEIFMAKGDYNQDLMPTNMLVEVGTHTNDRQRAEKGIALFADAVPVVLGVGNAPGSRPGAREINKPVVDPTSTSPGAARSVLIVLSLLVVIGGGYLVINEGGVKQAWERVKNTAGRELTGLLGYIRENKEKRGLKTKTTPEDFRTTVVTNQENEGCYDPEENKALREAKDEIRKD